MKTLTRCCEPLLTKAISESEAEDLAATMKVLADPARLRLLSIISSATQGECCVCDLVDVVGRSQSTVSHHLSVLHEAGLVSREKRGRWAWYRAVPERLAGLRDAFTL